MKIKLVLYWTTTILIALETLAGGLVDLTHGRTQIFSGPHVAEVVSSLGYPVYILAILGLWKIPGAVTLVVPGFLRLKEWAYGGIVFELSGAVVSLAVCGHTKDIVVPAALTGLAMASYMLRPPDRILGTSVAAERGMLLKDVKPS
jgi:hypothetical protein